MSDYRFRSTLWLLLTAWVGIVAFAAHLLMSAETSRWERYFDEEARALASDVKHKLDTNEAVLAGFSAFLQAVDRSDTASTEKYAASAAAAYPHIYMIEVARQVRLSDQPALQASLRQGWRADFSLKDFSEISGHGLRNDERKNYTWPILFLYPSLPEAQAIYGVRLETVDYLAQSMALAQKSIKPVVSPAFDLYEGERAYILLQKVTRPDSVAPSELNFFGDTMMALLLIKTQALLPAASRHDDREKIRLTATLASPANPDSLLFEQQAVASGRIDQLFLPRFTRRINIDNASQPTAMSFDQQMEWSNLLSYSMVMTVIFLCGALVLVPWITLRHYRALDRSAREYEHSAYLATHDLLTGLPNRYLFSDRFEHASRSAQRNGHSFALLLVDLDHFKEINDQHGHEVGDQVLVACSRRMEHNVRAGDTVARHGGDEFVILLPNILNADDAAGVGEKILRAISAPIDTTAGSMTVSCSIGISIYPVHGDNLDLLRKKADRAMYQAKQQGRNAVAMWSAEIN